MGGGEGEWLGLGEDGAASCNPVTYRTAGSPVDCETAGRVMNGMMAQTNRVLSTSTDYGSW